MEFVLYLRRLFLLKTSVVQVLDDQALLKRYQKEIKDLKKKLRGESAHDEVSKLEAEKQKVRDLSVYGFFLRNWFLV